MENIDKHFCEQAYAGSPLLAQERRVIKQLFEAYRESDRHSAEKFLPGEIRFTGPTVRRAYLEKRYSDIIADIGGETVPRHSTRRNAPNVPTSHYSLYRVGTFGITLSAVWDEKRLPRHTDYRSSLIEGLEIPFEFAYEDAPDDPFLYVLFQHGKGDVDSAIPHYASYKAIDRQYGIVWTRNLFKHNAAYVDEIVNNIRPEKDQHVEEIVQLRQHLRRLQTGEEAE